MDLRLRDQRAGGWISAGLTVRPLGRFRGFFVQPKVLFHEAYSAGPMNTEVSVSDTCPNAPYPNGFDVDGGVGVTVGWDWVVLGHLSFGSAIGGSVTFGKTLSGALRFAQVGHVEVLAHVDLSLLRVGFAW